MTSSVMEDLTPNNREILLLLGASSDVGRALLKRLDGNPLTVYAIHRDSGAKLEALRSQLRTVEILPIRADLASEDEVSALAAKLKAGYALPTQIVHLAAPKLRLIRFKDVRWPDFEAEISVQLRSIVMLLSELLPAMSKRRAGKVVFVLSSAVWNVPPSAMSHYVTAKYALKGLMRALAAEYASKGLCINAVSPSLMETAFLEKLPARFAQIIAAQSPRGRNTSVEEVVGVIQFLLSEQATALTGVDFPVAGGSNF